ncbi:MAG TPA: hypothetical protein VJP02_30755 [Candidatus Sulfotelmatobacter sp.]|nr:hypothetical protein [Candidatus Sulfotelmatobacter sp.]
MKTLSNQNFLFGMALALATALVPPTASAASPNLFASVAGNGTLQNGNGVSSVTHIGIGRYEVTFTSDVSSCGYVSTTQNAFSQAIQSYTAGGHLSSSGVYVEVKNQGGGLTDGPFDVAVACNLKGWDFAVVGYAANLVRSSPGATLTHLGVGRYDVNFAAGVAACAYLATVGDPANALVFNPSGVYTGSGPTPNSVYIETKNPGGGLTDGIPFHLAVVCPNAVNTHVLVVQNTGLARRGSPLTSSFDLSTGNYIFVTNVSMAPCTMIGTRGSVDKSVPFTPTTVEITPGPVSNSSGIQVRQLLFFGGALVNQAFHAAGIC